MRALMFWHAQLIATRSRHAPRLWSPAHSCLMAVPSIASAGLFTALLLLCGVYNAAAQTDLLEYQVKAAFLYKFPAYVQWPSVSFSDASSPLVFGILQADAIADELALLARDKRIANRTVVIRKLRPGDSTTGLNILFVSQAQTRSSIPLLRTALSASILTVTEAPAQRPDGSVINFATIDDRVSFDVSLPMAEQATLTISSRLLQVARRVIESTQ